MNKTAVPETKFKQKKGWRNEIIQNQIKLGFFLMEIRKDISKIKKEMRDQIEKEVIKNLDDKVHLINSALNITMIMKEKFIEKGLIKREEINKRYEELRKKKDG